MDILNDASTTNCSLARMHACARAIFCLNALIWLESSVGRSSVLWNVLEHASLYTHNAHAHVALIRHVYGPFSAVAQFIFA